MFWNVHRTVLLTWTESWIELYRSPICHCQCVHASNCLYNIHIFAYFFKNHCVSFNQTWHNRALGKVLYQFDSCLFIHVYAWPQSSPKGDNSLNNWITHMIFFLKIILYQITELIFNWTWHVCWIQLVINEGHHPSTRGNVEKQPRYTAALFYDQIF